MHEAREEILRLNASLERRVQRRTRQLQQVNRELEAFSYSVSHDLKAPLAAIDGFTLVLSERLKDRMDDRERGYMRRVREGVASMFGLIDAMLGLHKLTHGTEVHHTRVDLSALAESIVAELRAAEPQRPCRARIEPGITVVGDEHLLANALRNLIGNSWKFSAQKPEVELEFDRDAQGPEGFTTIRLTDRGAGFDPRYAGKLFAPFQRLHHASEFPGTGVGLATVQRIVQQHGGLIRADGAPGEGASFWLSIPVAGGDAGDSTREE
jgi:signal transduction histidine kinase